MMGMKMKKCKIDIPYIVALFLVILSCFLCSRFCFQLLLIQGQSMEPSYRSGQLIMINKLDREFKQGDCVLFYCDSLDENLVKRIVAQPGDRVQISAGKLYVNGLAHFPYPDCPLIAEAGLAARELLVPQGQYFVLGDNFAHSIDSRHPQVGLVDAENIKGKLFE